MPIPPEALEQLLPKHDDKRHVETLEALVEASIALHFLREALTRNLLGRPSKRGKRF